MEISLAVACVFLLVSVCVAATCYVVAEVWSHDSRRLSKRMAEEFRAPDRTAARSPLFKDLDDLDLAAPPTEADLPAAPPIRLRLQALLGQADVGLSVRQLGWLSLALATTAAGAAAWWLGPSAVAPAALLGLLLPLLVLRTLGRRRREQLLKRLPEAFELMARVIRAGQSVPQALQAVADSFTGPLGREFADCQHRQSLGQRPEVTFRAMAERSGILELRIFVMAMLIHRQAGGNLSEVLERLATLVRARQRLQRQLRTATAEGRLQGWTLAVLPMLIFGVLLVINRPYAEVLLQTPRLLLGTLALIVVGLLWIRKIVHFHV